jgi:hypothetical protein
MRVHHASAAAITCFVGVYFTHLATATIALAAQPKCAECEWVVARVMTLLPRRPQQW